MKLEGIVYYLAKEGPRPHIRLHVVGWLSDELGGIVQDVPADALVDVSVTRIGEYARVIKTVTDLDFGSEGFLTADIGLDWMDPSNKVMDKILDVKLSSPYGNVSCKLKKLPYEEGPWARVFVENLKLGVLIMAGQTQTIIELANLVTDKLRNALQVSPGDSNRFCQDVNPEVAPSWGSAISFGFSSIGMMFTNFGAIQVDFSFDGVNRHGILPPGKAKWFDFRRETQVYLQAASAAPVVTVEAW